MKFDIQFFKSPKGIALSIAIVLIIILLIIAVIFTFKYWSMTNAAPSNETVTSQPIISSVKPSSQISSIISSSSQSSIIPSSEIVSQISSEPSSEPLSSILSQEVIPDTDDPLLKKLYKAQNKNKDAVGWLHIDGTKCDYAVMQSEDNEYYLDKNEEKENSKRGALFADFRCHFGDDQLSTNTVIYGHSMKDGTMFTQLFVYKRLSTLNNYPIINFAVDEDTEQRWKIFSCMITDINFNYIEPNPTDEEFIQIIEESKKRSLFDTDVDVDIGDKILTLSTCTYEYKDQEARFVVMARQMREGEEETVPPAKKNKNIKQPQF